MSQMPSDDKTRDTILLLLGLRKMTDPAAQGTIELIDRALRITCGYLSTEDVAKRAMLLEDMEQVEADIKRIARRNL